MHERQRLTSCILTFRYLAPEVLRGERDNLEKADIFALGASLYELALGKDLPSGA